MIIDTHNLSTKEAIKLINEEIDRAINLKITMIRVIHGFNNGAAIKKRLHNLKNENINSMVTLPSNLGETIIYLKIKTI